MACLQWRSSFRNCSSNTRSSGSSPPRNATCSQLLIRSEWAPRNLPSNSCSRAASSPYGGKVTVDTHEANANQAYSVSGVVRPCTLLSSTEYTKKSTTGLSDCDNTSEKVSAKTPMSEVI